MSEDEEQIKRCKAVLIGEAGTGKTSIINRLKNNEFNPVQSPTMCSSMFKKLVETPGGESVLIEIWDTAGQEKYRSINKLFYKDAAIIIMVYDITNQRSFDEIKNYWYEQIKENCDLQNIILAVSANKSDLFNQEKVKEEHGKMFANRIKGIFQATSCFTGLGINDLFNQVGLKYIQRTGLPQPPKPLPSPKPPSKKCCKSS